MIKLTITFNPAKERVYVNRGCLKILPDMDYAYLMVLPRENSLALFPLNGDEPDALRLRSGRETPKMIRCPEFMRKIIILMGWNYAEQYKLYGNLARYNNKIIFVFDLACAEPFKPPVRGSGV